MHFALSVQDGSSRKLRSSHGGVAETDQKRFHSLLVNGPNMFQEISVRLTLPLWKKMMNFWHLLSPRLKLAVVTHYHATRDSFRSLCFTFEFCIILSLSSWKNDLLQSLQSTRMKCCSTSQQPLRCGRTLWVAFHHNGTSIMLLVASTWPSK